MNISNPRFKYTPALLTNVGATFKRFGFRPTTPEERQARQDKLHADEPKASVTAITKARTAS